MSGLSQRPTVLIVGASRGLGLALAEEYLSRGWDVVGTVRGSARTGLHGLLETTAGKLEIERVDIVEPDQIEGLRGRLRERRFDLLFVNAGISNGAAPTIAEVSTEEFTRLMVTNALAPLRTVEALQDLVPNTGTIAVMSSGLGSVANNESGAWETYRASKAALNTLMRSFAARHSADPRCLLVLAPGWVRTDMGGPTATLSIEESIPRLVDVVTGQSGRPGLRFLNYRGETVPW